jgi:hypothetical protein
MHYERLNLTAEQRARIAQQPLRWRIEFALAGAMIVACDIALFVMGPALLIGVCLLAAWIAE